jgi:hypothetical protein
MQESEFVTFIDALGHGVCGLRNDGKLDRLSTNFMALTGTDEDALGRTAGELLEELPALDAIPREARPSQPLFRQVGSDGVARELTAVLLPRAKSSESDGGWWLVLIDRSREAQLRRHHDRLGRRLDDLRSELEARQRVPLAAAVRPMHEFAARLDEAVLRARRYEHAVTILRLRMDAADEAAERDLDPDVLGCIRAVDEAGMVDARDYAVVLPHTDLVGGRIVGERLHRRLIGAGCTRVSVGAAQLQREEESATLVARADRACTQAAATGGGVLVAVDVT